VRGSLGLAWGLFLVYGLWSLALQGVLAAPQLLGEWVPDLGVLMLVASTGRMPPARGLPAALLLVFARASFSADAPLFVAAALLGALGLAAGIRSFLQVDRAVPRALLCALAAWGAGHLLLAGRAVVLAADSPVPALASVRLWPSALATGIACLFLAPLYARLPGLAPLSRARP